MESKYHPQQLGEKEYAELGKTVSLMLRMCKLIVGTGKEVILFSCFCVAKSITKIEAKGVYVGSLIKKRCYFLK